MSQIIDNVKVGNHIKSLLKKHKMTQSELADRLSISKSAVSQNLSGRSTFDIENLLKIAKIFDISLEALIGGEKENLAYVSNYEKIVDKGLKGIQQANAKDLRIAEPDFYGKVLVDYIIDAEKWDMLIYLHNHDVSFTHDYFRRAEDVILKVLLALLEHDIKDVVKYFIKYKNIHGDLRIDDDNKGYLIWKLLDKPSNQDIVKQLINAEIIHQKKMFNVFDYKQKDDLVNKSDIIHIMGKYKLIHVLSSYLQTIHKDEDFSDLFDTFFETQFFEGIKTYVHHYDQRQLNYYKKVGIGVQKCILRLVKDQQFDLVIEFLKNRLYTNLTEVLRLSIENNHNKIASHIIANYKDDITFKKIGEYCIDYKNIELFNRIFMYLTNEDLDYLLAYTKPKDIDSMIFLVKRGARLRDKYYNLDTYDKFNQIIDYLVNEEA